MKIIYIDTPNGIMYWCRITQCWRDAVIVNGVFFPIAIPCSLFAF